MMSVPAIYAVYSKKEGDTFEAGIEGGMAGQARIVSLNDTGLRFDFTPLTDGKPLFRWK